MQKHYPDMIIFTAWHANMNLLYPSKKMEFWRPGHSSTRDMIGDMIKAVKAKGIKIYLYTHPRDGMEFSEEEKEATGWGAGVNQKYAGNPNWATFDYPKWNNFIIDIYGELVDRYGNDIDGIWIDEGSSYGDSYRVVDYDRLRKTIKTRNPNLTIINDFYGTTYACDLGMKEYGPGWGEFAQTDGNKWPAFTIPVGVVMARDWWAAGPIGKNSVRFSAADMFRYTVLEAGANTNGGGGVAWAAGPYAGYPTVSGKTINDLSWGVATRSLDNHFEFIHVLKPPQGKSLALPVPEDGKRFRSAKLLKDGVKVSLKQNENGVEITLPDGEAWDPHNTVIQLTVSGSATIPSQYSWINDTEYEISYEGTGWKYSRWERKHGDYDNDVHLTTLKGDRFLYPFVGSGIEYLGSRSSTQGKCDIYIDGVYQTTIDAF